MEQEKVAVKIFDLYDTSNIEVKDRAIKPYINLNAKLLLKSHGRNQEKFAITKVNIVERLANRLAVAGHRGKKHKLELGDITGKFTQNMKIILKVFAIIEKQTGKNQRPNYGISKEKSGN